MKHIFKSLLIFIFFYVFTSCETLDALLGTVTDDSNGITNEEAISAFKSAMNIGASAASDNLGREDGYYKNEMLKILLPPEADIIIDNLAKIPFGQALVDDVVLRINRSAETAAKEVAPIFASAITEMTVIDGLEIVFGDKTACTNYLHEKTYDKLVELFLPKMQSCLNSPMVMGISANTAWEKLVTAYNTVAKPANMSAKLFGQPEPMPAVTADLGRFTTEKALDGLFTKVAAEEKKIRDTPLSYPSEIVRKVFSYVKSNQK